MKQGFLVSLLACVLIGGSGFGQTSATVTLNSITQTEDVVELNMSSDKPFFIGDNRFVLHIGALHFLRCKHPEGDESKLTFMISEEEFAALRDGGDITLVYGFYYTNTQMDGEGNQAEFTGTNWKVGKLNKALLTR